MPKRSKPPHQPDKTALYLDTIRPEYAGLVSLVGGLKRDRGAASAQPLQGDFFVVNERDDDTPVFGRVAALDDDCVAIENPGFDHAVPGHFESVVLASPPEEASRDPTVVL